MGLQGEPDGGVVASESGQCCGGPEPVVMPTFAYPAISRGFRCHLPNSADQYKSSFQQGMEEKNATRAVSSFDSYQPPNSTIWSTPKERQQFNSLGISAQAA
jgi:hypothetical protein